MANIVVYGGSGFIGRQAVYAAQARGHTVGIVDLVEPNYDFDGPFLPHSPETLEGTLRSFDEMKIHFDHAGSGAHIDAIVNYIALFKYGMKDEEMFGPNIMTANNLARICAQNDIFMVHTGAIASHGNKTKSPLKESHPLNPFEPYARSKAVSEEKVFTEIKKGLRAITFRPCGVYGPQGTRAMMHEMFETAKNSPVLPCTQTRNSYINTIDIGRSAIFAIENQHLFYGRKRVIDTPKSLGDIAFNIADNEPMRDGDVLRHLSKRIGRSALALPLPRFALYLAAMSPKVPLAVARMGQIDHYQCNEKFQAIFEDNGFVRSFNSTQDGLDHTLRWLYTHHWKEDMPEALRQAETVWDVKDRFGVIECDLVKVTYDMQAGRADPHIGPSSVQIVSGFFNTNPERLHNLDNYGKTFYVDSRTSMKNGVHHSTIETPIHVCTVTDVKVLEGSKYR